MYNYTQKEMDTMREIGYKQGIKDTIYNIIGTIVFIGMLYVISLIVVLI